MRNAIAIVYTFMLLIVLASCSKDEPATPITDLPANQPEVTLKGDTLYDHRDGQNYPVMEINGLIWMSQNLNTDMPDSWYYNNDPNNAFPYGRLYPWESAMKACPNGWRLPTEEEMEALIEHEGGYASAFRTLLAGGESNFNAVLGGLVQPGTR